MCLRKRKNKHRNQNNRDQKANGCEPRSRSALWGDVEGEKRMHDIEYNKADGDRFLKLHEHPELFKHFVIPVADSSGIVFYITYENLRNDIDNSPRYGYASVPGYYGVGSYRYNAGAIYVNREDSFWDKLFKRTFFDRCDSAVKKLEEICPKLDAEFTKFHDEYLKTVHCVKRYRFKKFSIDMQIPKHDDDQDSDFR
jgi:hypothetical protein